MSIYSLPNIVAICGKPNSGKSTAAEALKNKWGYSIIDDGKPMRDFAINYIGAEWHQVHTQNGKNERVSVVDDLRTGRDILGTLGNCFESAFGPDFIPWMAWKQMNMSSNHLFVMPSVRREQGVFWKSKGALVLEVDSDEPESSYEFDQYSKEVVDITVKSSRARGLSDEESVRLFKLDVIRAIEQWR